MSKKKTRYPEYMEVVRVKVEHGDEVYFIDAYFDGHSQTWRDAYSDNVLHGVKSWNY